MTRTMLLLWSAFVLLLGGCQFAMGGVELKPVHSSVQKPSNVAVYVAVSDGDEPLDELDESHFTVFENDNRLDKTQTQLTLLERDQVAVHHVLLLVDLSGQLTEPSRASLKRALEGFAETVTKTQGLSIFAFDGGTEIWNLGEFPKGAAQITIGELKSGDPSRNLNGAILAGLKRLDAHLMRVKRPIRVGTLVTLTRGPDVAGRETQQTVMDALDASPHEAFSVGLVGEDNYYLDDIGPAGKTEASSLDTMGVALEEAARRLERAHNRYYLVQYCSPARAGTPTFRLVVTYTNKEGHERSGALELAFDASGFGPGCDPRAPPRFQVAAKEPWEIDARPQDDASKSSPSSGAEPTPSTPGAEPNLDTDEDGDEGIVPPPDKPGYE